MQSAKRKSCEDKSGDGEKDLWDSYMSAGRCNIVQTIPRTKPRIDGQAYLFWIVPQHHGTIKGRLFSKQRVHPNDVMNKEEYDFSTTFFLENRNLQNLPYALKGCLCAIRNVDSTNDADYRLCIIFKADYAHDRIQYVHWIGPVHKTSENETIASFQMLIRNNLVADDDLLKHFQLRTCFIKEIDVIFLSKVAGWDFLLKMPIQVVGKKGVTKSLW